MNTPTSSHMNLLLTQCHCMHSASHLPGDKRASGCLPCQWYLCFRFPPKEGGRERERKGGREGDDRIGKEEEEARTGKATINEQSLQRSTELLAMLSLLPLHELHEQIYMHTCSHMHTHRGVHMHARTHARAHTHTHIHIHANTHQTRTTHMYTHTQTR